MKTRIAIYAKAPPGWGGSFQYASSILDAVARLDSARYEIHAWYIDPAWKSLLMNKNIPATPLARGAEDLAYRAFARGLAMVGLREALPALSRQTERLEPVARRISGWKPDICINLQQTSLALPKSVRQVSPIHDLMHLYEDRFPEVAERSEKAARQWLFKNIVRRARMILVDSPLGRQHVQDSYSVAEEQLFVLPFIAPSSLISAVPSRPPLLPEKIGTGDFLFYPAQFWLHKNHAGLLEAVARLREIDMQCIFSGTLDKNGYPAAKAAISRLGLASKVHILGYVSDTELSWLYRNARFMVMPTFLGPTNIPPLEAMSLRCPVAVSDVYGMREQLGDGALYFNPASPESIATAIARLWNDDDLRHKLREAGSAKIACWNAEHFEERFLEMLRLI